MPHLAAIGALLAWVSTAGAQTIVKIGLAVPNYGPFAPVYAADELGYYKENGVTAEITAYRGGPAAPDTPPARAGQIVNFFSPRAAAARRQRQNQKTRCTSPAQTGPPR